MIDSECNSSRENLPGQNIGTLVLRVTNLFTKLTTGMYFTFELIW